MRCGLGSVKASDLASGRLCLLKEMVSGRVKGECYKRGDFGVGVRCGLGSIKALDLASGRLCLLKGMVSGRVNGEGNNQETLGRV